MRPTLKRRLILMITSKFKIVKKRLPLIVALLCAISFWITGDYYITLTTTNGPFEFIKLLASIAGTILGFLIGAVSLLTAVMDRTLIQNMRQNGQYEVLINYTFIACLTLLILVISCFFAFLIDSLHLKLIFTIIIFLSVYSALAVVAIGIKFKNIFTVIS